MTKEECFYLGHVSKTFSFRGEVVLYLDTTHPEAYREMESVFVEINNKLVPFFIEAISFDRKENYARVKFEGIDSEQAAHKLVKKEIYLPLSMQHESEDEFDLEELEGYLVKDANQASPGKVVNVIDHPLNPVIEVEFGNDRALVPINGNFVLAVDNQKRLIETDIPEGLFNLNS